MDNHNDIVLAGCHHRSKRGRPLLSYTVLSNVRYTILLLLILLPCLPSCSPKIVEKVVYQHDTTTVHHRDSIFRKDSVYVKEWMKGDTVYIDRFRDRYIYKDRWRDSIRVVCDSVAFETIKEVKVEKPLSWWQKARMGAFWWLLAGLAACLGWIFRKQLLSLFGKLL